jgi:hypothetical protein
MAISFVDLPQRAKGEALFQKIAATLCILECLSRESAGFLRIALSQQHLDCDNLQIGL